MEDGGSRDRVITYEAYPNETPVFSSGIKVESWEKIVHYPEGLPIEAEGKVWKASIPAGIDTVLTMYDGDIRLKRTCGKFFMPTMDIEYKGVDSLNVAHDENRDLLRRVDFPEGALRAWENIHDIELRFMAVPWTVNLRPLRSIDLENNRAWLDIEATAPLCAKSRGIRVENAIDHLNTPGSWCVNTKKREIYYWPHEDKPSENILIPCLKEFIRINGEIDYNGQKDIPVQFLHFKGLTFKHGRRDQTSKDYKGSGIQHDWEMFDKDTAIFRFRGAENCSLTNCHFYATSGTAIRLDLHCKDITIENNLLDDIGSMGILLCGYGPGTKDVNGYNTIRNNIITRCGEVIWHGHGIFLWQSGHNIIEHNKIHHSARKGIGLCGVRVTILRNREHDFDEASRTIRWHEIDKAINWKKTEMERYLPFLHTRDNIVKNNEIYRVLEKIGDGSALNISGAGTGNIIKNNYIHHLATYSASSAIRVDDWQCGTTMVGNIVYMCNISAVVRKNYNHLINNIFIDTNVDIGYVKFASYPDEKEAYGSLLQNNIYYESGNDATFYGKGYLISDEATYPHHCKVSNNVFYCAGDKEYAKNHIETYQKMGIEQNSICADPLFKDIEKEDFSLLPESPALTLGFIPIDQSKIGITQSFPEALKKLEYNPTDEIVYSRGRDKSKKGYEWW